MTVRSVPGALIGLPLISNSPEVGSSKPATIFSSVDFPQPLGPRSVKKAPSAMSRLISFSMQVVSPERLEKLFEIFLSESFGNVALFSFARCLQADCRQAPDFDSQERGVDARKRQPPHSYS